MIPHTTSSTIAAGMNFEYSGRRPTTDVDARDLKLYVVQDCESLTSNSSKFSVPSFDNCLVFTQNIFLCEYENTPETVPLFNIYKSVGCKH